MWYFGFVRSTLDRSSKIECCINDKQILWFQTVFLFRKNNFFYHFNHIVNDMM